MIEDIKPPDQPQLPAGSDQPVDDVAQPAEDLSQKLDAAAGGVDQVAGNLEGALERGLDTAEQKLDGFLDDLGKFLGKF